MEYRGAAGGDEEHPVIYLPHDQQLARLGRVLCFFGRDSSVSAGAGTELLCTRSSAENLGAFRAAGVQAEHDSGEPAITSHPFGKGRAIYLAGDVGGAYMNSPYPLLRRLVAELAGRGQPPLTVTAPEQI